MAIAHTGELIKRFYFHIPNTFRKGKLEKRGNEIKKNLLF
jgi:hypothetical protein